VTVGYFHQLDIIPTTYHNDEDTSHYTVISESGTVVISIDLVFADSETLASALEGPTINNLLVPPNEPKKPFHEVGSIFKSEEETSLKA
jgi:hypothetical protein